MFHSDPVQAVQTPPTFTATADSILQDAKHIVNTCRKEYNRVVASVLPSKVDFGDTILPLAYARKRKDSRRTGVDILQVMSRLVPKSARRHSKPALFLTSSNITLTFPDIHGPGRYKIVIIIVVANRPRQSPLVLSSQLLAPCSGPKHGALYYLRQIFLCTFGMANH